MSEYSKRLPPQTWPQDTLRIPNAAGRFMPPIEKGNADIARQEAFTMSGTFNLSGSSSVGQVRRIVIPTDQDGDFWCDQIYLVNWGSTIYRSGFSPRALLNISDLRTGRSLTYPNGVPAQFFMTLILFADDAGFDVAASPPPDGFRSTATLPQPFCFTRQGGIVVTLTSLYNLPDPGSTGTTDISFGGWKEYTHAARGKVG